ncbi:E3 ubiquitin-protein ligase parkin [Culicoides brevitarsis]|uniref:E3 ubiquitin-protein ligase parkin n=1 Tax=Culicoides brevitarsis TaxID=469753 RepID=UPI00307B6553
MQFLLDFFRELIYAMIQLLSFGRKKIENSLFVYIKSNTGNTISVDLNPEWDIANVKEFIAPKLGMSPQEVKIIFAGKELADTIHISECDLGQRSILHAVKSRPSVRDSNLKQKKLSFSLAEEDEDPVSRSETPTAPLCETLIDLQLDSDERKLVKKDEMDRKKAHFYVHCSTCQELCNGKLRVRCRECLSGAFTVHRDPENWADVLQPQRITGCCEGSETPCTDKSTGGPPFAEFYFKCAKHVSQGEKDYAAPLTLIKTNLKDVPCLACGDLSDPVLVFPCKAGHTTCLECFRQYCSSRLADRQFIAHPDIGYTLACPTGCDESFIEEIHHFKLLTKEQYDRYQRFATEEYVLQAGGILCPQPGCGMGLLPDPDCTRVVCQNGCGYVFCRRCLQGYHIGDCLPESTAISMPDSCRYAVDPERAAEARWDEASKVTIKVISKPCPKCRTPTERDGGCMHMVCTRSGCNFEWCWVCQIEWNRDCMGNHWF